MVEGPLVLHVGNGGHGLPDHMAHCREVTCDLNPGHNPDIVADMADLPDGIGPFDSIYSSHCLEHLPFHKTQQCLKGWLKVLRPGGTVQIWVPDLTGIEPTDEVIYVSPSGPITKRDLFYGHDATVASGHPYMQHLSGFTETSLRQQLTEAGFEVLHCVGTRDNGWNLIGIGRKPE